MQQESTQIFFGYVISYLVHISVHFLIPISHVPIPCYDDPHKLGDWLKENRDHVRNTEKGGRGHWTVNITDT